MLKRKNPVRRCSLIITQHFDVNTVLWETEMAPSKRTRLFE